VNFNVGYYDEYGNLIDSLRAAGRHYIRRWDGVLIDVVSILPVDLAAPYLPHPIPHFIGLIHLLRFIHIKRYLKTLQSKLDVKYDVVAVSTSEQCFPVIAFDG